VENIESGTLDPHVEVTPEGLVVDFEAIREETIARYGFAEKPADEPWIIGKVSREDFELMKEAEEAEANANQ
jgi:hypothetical protein